ncbi:tyrosine-type recombinase/integrase [Azonexus sp. IMCC34842]|uniref:tyrosine-type recombinase/integrase n=1 Tax=Azonexus sp. IMCC34842 TaxID=3420950 RepID=UPI003D151B68
MAGITDKEVRALIAKAQREGKAQYQVDGSVPGLTISASKTGRASWYIRYRLAGKQKERTIGQYPAWGAAEARDKGKELRREIDGGIDVAIEKQRQKQEALLAITVDMLAAEYFQKAEKGMTLKTGMRPHTFKQRKSIHERYVSPLIGRFEASTITPAQVVNIVKKAEAGGKTLPDITLTHCNLIFAHGIGNGACTSNPCRDLKLSAIVGPREPPKQRIAMGAEELGAFLRELHRMPRPYELTVRLMLLTGVRINTIAEAMICEFKPDFAVWEVPHERRKNRRHTTGPFVIPLPAQAVEWACELIKLADTNDYLLPVNPIRGAGIRNPLSKRTTVAGWIDRVRAESGGTWRRITPHDLRSTCKTWLSELRVDYETRQRYLDHSLDSTVDNIYDKADYREHRLAAAKKWLAFLNDLEAGKESANVSDIRCVG